MLTLRIGESSEVRCEKCGGRQADRLLSRFAMPKSDEARLASLADPSRLGDLDENDPKSVARWMSKAGREIGEEAGGEEIDRMVGEIEGDGTAGGDED